MEIAHKLMTTPSGSFCVEGEWARFGCIIMGYTDKANKKEAKYIWAAIRNSIPRGLIVITSKRVTRSAYRYLDKHVPVAFVAPGHFTNEYQAGEYLRCNSSLCASVSTVLPGESYLDSEEQAQGGPCRRFAPRDDKLGSLRELFITQLRC